MKKKKKNLGPKQWFMSFGPFVPITTCLWHTHIPVRGRGQPLLFPKKKQNHVEGGSYCWWLWMVVANTQESVIIIRVKKDKKKKCTWAQDATCLEPLLLLSVRFLFPSLSLVAVVFFQRSYFKKFISLQLIKKKKKEKYLVPCHHCFDASIWWWCITTPKKQISQLIEYRKIIPGPK